MDAQDRERFERIVAFEIDEPGADFPFAARLARENAWSRDYAQRVVDEYKKFAFLAVAAGHPVTPSEQVDQAWHLHLTYTHSYWERFCPDVLGKPLHHNPTKGGSEEQAKFVVWYNRTLESYRWLFRQEPPRDIWPDAEARFGEDIAYCRVNRRRHWIIPKPRLKWLSAAAVMLVFGLVLAAGCSSGLLSAKGAHEEAAAIAGAGALSAKVPHAGVSNPFGLAGPEFLGFFAVVLAIATAFAVIVRYVMRRPGDDGFLDQRSLDPYEAAYLAGGRKATINAAIASLASDGAVAVDAVNHRFTCQDETSRAAPLHAVEQAVLRATDSGFGTDLKDLHRDYGPIDTMADDLRTRGLIVSRERDLLGRVLPVLIVLAVAAFGVVRIFQGVSRDKPVGFLVMACLAAVVFAFAAFGRRLHRTHRGDRVLSELKSANAALLPIKGQSHPGLAGQDLATALGLFGVGILAAGPLSDLHTALKPSKSCGGGAGSSFWGCGGACGGGGGGGGGCGGGCGGCGG